MKAMILAAGKGTRMGKASQIRPKPLTRINNKTLIELNIERHKQAGIDQIVINISWLGDMIIDHLGDGSQLGVKISYSDERKKLLGTGGGIFNALKFLGSKPFWLINSDIYTEYKINKNLRLKTNKLCHLVLVNNPNHHLSGDFNISDDNVTYNYQKCKDYTFSGISLISPRLFEKCKTKIFPLEPILKKYARLGKVSGEIYSGQWIDVGTKSRLSKLKKMI